MTFQDCKLNYVLISLIILIIVIYPCLCDIEHFTPASTKVLRNAAVCPDDISSNFSVDLTNYRCVVRNVKAPDDGVCPENTTYERNKYLCKKNDTDPDYSCEPAYKYDVSLNKCIYMKPYEMPIVKNCSTNPANYEYDSVTDSCKYQGTIPIVIAPTMTCFDNYKLDGSSCKFIMTQAPFCSNRNTTLNTTNTRCTGLDARDPLCNNRDRYNASTRLCTQSNNQTYEPTQCPSSFVYNIDSKKCVKSVDLAPECPKNYNLDVSKCVINSVVNPNYTCTSTGYRYNTTTRLCTKNNSTETPVVSCDAHYDLSSNNKCYLRSIVSSNLTCNSSYDLSNNNMCYYKQAYTPYTAKCNDPDYNLNDGKTSCVYKKDYTKDARLGCPLDALFNTTSRKCERNIYDNVLEYKCDQGYLVDKEEMQCYINTDMSYNALKKCPDGYTFGEVANTLKCAKDDIIDINNTMIPQSECTAKSNSYFDITTGRCMYCDGTATPTMVDGTSKCLRGVLYEDPINNIL